MAVRQLSPDLLEIAKKTLNEDPKRIQEDITAIKTWLKKQPHLKSRLDDQWILTFLRGTKFSLERTKEKLDTYYTYKSMLPEFFANRDPLAPELSEILQLGTTAFLPKPDRLGRQIFLIRCTLADPKKQNSIDVMRVNFMNIDTALLEGDRGIVAGEVVIMDFKDATLAQLTSLSPAMLKKSMSVYQDAYPIRPQALHFINTSPLFETTFRLMKSFMKKKLQDRVFVYTTDLTKLYDHVPRDLLPKEYGGELPSINELSAGWTEKVQSHRAWFLDDKNYGSNEQLRPGKPKTVSEVFGVEGSFRSLNVD